MYHGLHADACAPGVFDAVYSVRPDAFARQLDWLAAHGYRTLCLDAAYDARGRNVLITFDDGDISNAEIALPLLRERGMVAEFFVTAGFVDRPGRLASEDLRRLVAAGMGVQAHGLSHCYLDELDAEQLELELCASRQRLEAITRTPVTGVALPGGRGAARERDAALRLGYRDVLGSTPGRNLRRRRGEYLQRLAITRPLALEDFARIVAWRGIAPRLQVARHHALALAKRAFGNRRYDALRARLLGS